MNPKLLSIVIPFLVVIFFWITYKLKKVPILKYISKWPWGVRIVKNEYLRTLFNREKNRVKNVNNAVKLAKLRNQAENLKMYVIEVQKGSYWIGTLREWNIERKHYPKMKHVWPPRDSVFQTR